jgi:hypothetical protein
MKKRRSRKRARFWTLSIFWYTQQHPVGYNAEGAWFSAKTISILQQMGATVKFAGVPLIDGKSRI